MKLVRRDNLIISLHQSLALAEVYVHDHDAAADGHALEINSIACMSA
jgi:hypothetical protein